jgi:Tfp pilus assembly protein PilF
VNAEVLDRVHALVELERWQEALDLLGRSEMASAQNWEAACLHAQILVALGRPRQALTLARQARTAAPDEEWPHRLVSGLCVATGRTGEARSAAQEAVRLAPDTIEPLYTLVQAELLAGDLPAAQSTAAQALSQHPTSPLAHRALAHVAVKIKDWKSAEAALRRALQLEPQSTTLQLELADVLEHAGEGNAGTALRVNALRSDPTSSHARRALGRGLGGAALGGGAIKVLAALQVRNVVSNATRPVLLGCLFGLITLSWALTRWHHWRAGRALPHGFYDGLRADRRREDGTWVMFVGLVLLAVAVVDALLWGHGRVSAVRVVLELGAGAAVVLGGLWIRQRYPDEDGVADDRSASDLIRAVAVALRPLRGRARAKRDRTPILVGAASGRQRLPGALGMVSLTGLVVVPSFAGSAMAGFLAAATVLLMVPLWYDGRPRRVADPDGFRLVARASTAETLPRALRVVRHLLRFLLLPVIAVEVALFYGRAHRCLHDRLTGAEVVLVRLSLLPASVRGVDV